MKIIHVSPSYKPAYIYGGPTFSIAKMCEELSAENLDIEVLTTTANGGTELKVAIGKQVTIEGVKVTYFKRLTKDHSHFSPALLWTLYKKLNTTCIVHIHSWWNAVSILACLIAKQKKAIIVLSPRGTLTKYSLNNRKTILKTMIQKTIGKKLLFCCHILVTSEKEKSDVLAIQTPKTITVIPNFMNLPTKKYIQPVASGTFKLIFLSRIEEKKGLELLFQALSQINFSWTLTLAGTGKDGYIKRLKALAKDLNISNSISWVGHIEDDQKYQLLSSHHLLALFSYNENFANVVLESLIMGTPVAISDQVGLADFVVENDLGWVCPLHATTISQHLNNAWLDTQKRERIRNYAPVIVSEQYHRQSLIQQHQQFYDTRK